MSARITRIKELFKHHSKVVEPKDYGRAQEEIDKFQVEFKKEFGSMPDYQNMDFIKAAGKSHTYSYDEVMKMREELLTKELVEILKLPESKRLEQLNKLLDRRDLEFKFKSDLKLHNDPIGYVKENIDGLHNLNIDFSKIDPVALQKIGISPIGYVKENMDGLSKLAEKMNTNYNADFIHGHALP